MICKFLFDEFLGLTGVCMFKSPFNYLLFVHNYQDSDDKLYYENNCEHEQVESQKVNWSTHCESQNTEEKQHQRYY